MTTVFGRDAKAEKTKVKTMKGIDKNQISLGMAALGSGASAVLSGTGSADIAVWTSAATFLAIGMHWWQANKDEASAAISDFIEDKTGIDLDDNAIANAVDDVLDKAEDMVEDLADDGKLNNSNDEEEE